MGMLNLITVLLWEFGGEQEDQIKLELNSSMHVEQ